MTSDGIPSADSSKSTASLLTSAIPLEQLYRLTIREWRIFVVTLAIFLCLAVAKYLISTPMYEATLVLVPNSFQPAESSNQSGSLPSSLSNLIGISTSGTRVDDYQRFRLLLNSQRVAAGLLADKRIAATIDGPNRSNGLPGLFGIAKKPFTTEMMARYLTRSLRQGPATERLVVQLSYRSSDPDFARYFVMKVQQLADNEVRRSDTLKFQEYKKYLEAELERTAGVSNREAMIQLLARVMQRLMLLTSSMPYAAEILDGPRLSDGPVSPSLVLDASIAFILSVFFSFGLIVLKKLHPAFFARLPHRRGA